MILPQKKAGGFQCCVGTWLGQAGPLVLSSLRRDSALGAAQAIVGLFSFLEKEISCSWEYKHFTTVLHHSLPLSWRLEPAGSSSGAAWPGIPQGVGPMPKGGDALQEEMWSQRRHGLVI